MYFQLKRNQSITLRWSDMDNKHSNQDRQSFWEKNDDVTLTEDAKWEFIGGHQANAYSTDDQLSSTAISFEAKVLKNQAAP